tara:strand:- start:1282 stop:1926 length:645 start_codon:yes stop_codon:yes gene_type:complete
MIDSTNPVYDFIAKKENEKLYNDIQIFKENIPSYAPRKIEVVEKFIKNTLLKPYTDEVDKIKDGTYAYGLRVGQGYITNPATTIPEMEMQFKERVNQDLNFVKSLNNENLNLNKNQMAAITSLVYNIGQDRFKNSEAYKNLLKGDLENFKKEAFDSKIGFVKDKKGGTIIQGLVNRRQEEQELFNKEVEESKPIEDKKEKSLAADLAARRAGIN